ncbi:MAG: hypothetical protein A2X49_00110 [Lentisphaerae bacterium GWF2_52_8]|nr:MAG: hypothetical protein A2X49_00110 [Lentisphaerae bacterium GWF2_52_8]
MDFYDVIRKRRSIRAYKPDPIPEQALLNIAEAVREAPTACNLQPFSFRVIFEESLRKKISSCYSRSWLSAAPAIVVALANFDSCWKRLDGSPSADIDIGIAMEHFVLSAAAEGLGTCWICAYDVSKMNTILNVLPPWSALAISPLGYPAETPAPAKRKAMEELFKVIR